MLAIRDFHLPFHSMSELADNDDYRLVDVPFRMSIKKLDVNNFSFMVGTGGSTSVYYHQLEAAVKGSPEHTLFRKHIEPDINGTTFDSDRSVINRVSLLNKSLILFLLD